jgi:hypothetical protein
MLWGYLREPGHMDLIVTETLGAASGGTIMSGVGAMYEVRAWLFSSMRGCYVTVFVRFVLDALLKRAEVQ